MSRMGNYYINEMERKFVSVIIKDQNIICKDCGKPYWQHKGCECPNNNSMDEPI